MLFLSVHPGFLFHFKSLSLKEGAYSEGTGCLPSRPAVHLGVQKSLAHSNHDMHRENGVTFPCQNVFFRLCCGGVETLMRNPATSIKVLKVVK